STARPPSAWPRATGCCWRRCWPTPRAPSPPWTCWPRGGASGWPPRRAAGPAAEPVTAARMFEAWVERAPDAVAIDFAGEETSYAALNRRANRLARHLRRLGAGPGSIVAISLERSADPVAAVVAVWKAGGAYVPVDPDYPAERRAYMVAD